MRGKKGGVIDEMSSDSFPEHPKMLISLLRLNWIIHHLAVADVTQVPHVIVSPLFSATLSLGH